MQNMPTALGIIYYIIQCRLRKNVKSGERKCGNITEKGRTKKCTVKVVIKTAGYLQGGKLKEKKGMRSKHLRITGTGKKSFSERRTEL